VLRSYPYVPREKEKVQKKKKKKKKNINTTRWWSKNSHPLPKSPVHALRYAKNVGSREKKTGKRGVHFGSCIVPLSKPPLKHGGRKKNKKKGKKEKKKTVEMERFLQNYHKKPNINPQPIPSLGTALLRSNM